MTSLAEEWSPTVTELLTTNGVSTVSQLMLLVTANVCDVGDSEDNAIG